MEMERKLKHQAIMELIDEIDCEIKRGEEAYDKEVKGNHDISELRHIVHINKNNLIVKFWLLRKLEKLEEEV